MNDSKTDESEVAGGIFKRAEKGPRINTVLGEIISEARPPSWD